MEAKKIIITGAATRIGSAIAKSLVNFQTKAKCNICSVTPIQCNRDSSLEIYDSVSALIFGISGTVVQVLLKIKYSTGNYNTSPDFFDMSIYLAWLNMF